MNAENRSRNAADELARAKIMKFREEADYNTAISFTRAEYLGLHQEAVGLTDAMRRIIDQADKDGGIDAF